MSRIQTSRLTMWPALLCTLTLVGVASASISGHITADSCLCLTTSGVHARTGAGLGHSVVATLNYGECYKSSGDMLTHDGYHWYELQHVHGHHSVWVAGNYLMTSSLSHCGGTSGTEGHFNSSSKATTHPYATGVVSQHCLSCICQLESGCKPLGCHLDEGTDSCGYFQIKEVYWLDCGKPGGSLEACAADMQCSSSCIQQYMHRYIGYSRCVHNCESYARIHNGGPAGCHHSNTLHYWNNIQKLGCSANS
ncbi:lysozyme-like [Mizuhopecten yessoensis]|uniref:lysozyme n=1 Tax=Mizuhopecten yessoensis TaxID=6573 RepID=A0A210QMD6_MIZYE|nr:lysozyme-like [Mizuhopecten yessoensis]OWF49893.1 Lysozyme 3 [Mizuhopecten yessoensis]